MKMSKIKCQIAATETSISGISCDLSDPSTIDIGPLCLEGKVFIIEIEVCVGSTIGRKCHPRTPKHRVSTEFHHYLLLWIGKAVTSLKLPMLLPNEKLESLS